MAQVCKAKARGSSGVQQRSRRGARGQLTAWRASLAARRLRRWAPAGRMNPAADGAIRASPRGGPGEPEEASSPVSPLILALCGSSLALPREVAVQRASAVPSLSWSELLSTRPLAVAASRGLLYSADRRGAAALARRRGGVGARLSPLPARGGRNSTQSQDHEDRRASFFPGSPGLTRTRASLQTMRPALAPSGWQTSCGCPRLHDPHPLGIRAWPCTPVSAIGDGAAQVPIVLDGALAFVHGPRWVAVVTRCARCCVPDTVAPLMTSSAARSRVRLRLGGLAAMSALPSSRFPLG